MIKSLKDHVDISLAENCFLSFFLFFLSQSIVEEECSPRSSFTKSFEVVDKLISLVFS